ncbi:MAG: bacillithiol biosynthesis cysteine-adding enzyme BshC [Bacteroidetes bacterium]|nr:bacillithiol biosynthesis cysteine-adding enzyme BshC [Bacteroidota bacterium]
MIQTPFSFRDFSFGSKLVQDLIDRNERVREFSGEFFSTASIKQQIDSRNRFPVNREKLVDALNRQNNGLPLSEKSARNIQLLLNDNTYTITTGHQLNILTGPLFSIYKIAQALVIAKDLEETHPQLHFVPVFWMATEDHDFEEINHLHLFNKKITWNKTGQESSVAGRIHTADLAAFFEEIDALYQNDELKQRIKELAAYYLESETLAQATRKLINHLFGEYGLVILDGDDSALKELLKPVFLSEINNQVTFNAVTQTNQKLEHEGYHLQVHLRTCNLFFIHENGKRERIVYEDDCFKLDGKRYTASELSKQIDQNPAAFSPNALLRPVYQELILPNLVYIGGGGEIAYWLQLHEVFKKLNASFPLLRVRDSVFILNQKQVGDLEKSNLNLPQLQQPVDQLLKNRTLERLGDSISFTDAEADLFKAKSKVLEKVNQVDASLVSMVEAEFSRMITALEKIEAKLLKTEKDKDESSKNRLVKLQEKLFPGAHFQERHENFLNYYLNHPSFIDGVMKTVKSEDAPKIRTLIL